MYVNCCVNPKVDGREKEDQSSCLVASLHLSYIRRVLLQNYLDFFFFMIYVVGKCLYTYKEYQCYIVTITTCIGEIKMHHLHHLVFFLKTSYVYR